MYFSPIKLLQSEEINDFSRQNISLDFDIACRWDAISVKNWISKTDVDSILVGFSNACRLYRGSQRASSERYFVVTSTANKNELLRRGNRIFIGKEYNWKGIKRKLIRYVAFDLFLVMMFSGRDLFLSFMQELLFNLECESQGFVICSFKHF